MAFRYSIQSDNTIKIKPRMENSTIAKYNGFSVNTINILKTKQSQKTPKLPHYDQHNKKRFTFTYFAQ